MPWFSYWPGSAVGSLAVHVMLSPGARVVTAGVQEVVATTPRSLSVTWTFETGVFPVFVTTYVQVTKVPGVMNGPGGKSASKVFVAFSMSIAGWAPK